MAPLDLDIANGFMFEDDVLVNEVMSRSWDEERDGGIKRNGSGDMMEEAYDILESAGHLSKSSSNDGSEVARTVTSNSQSSKMSAPQQDIDRSGTKNDKSLIDDLAETKFKMHELTFHLFNDQSYAIKSKDAIYFGQARKGTPKKGNQDVAQQLDKLLGLGEYSNGNLIVSKVAPYVEPIVGSASSFLCLFRALFNIFTWRDPFLTFWISLFGFGLVLILLVFPWRIFFFVAGILVVGPQVSPMENI